MIFILILLLTGCVGSNSGDTEDASVLPGTSLKWERSMELEYADQFAVDYYEDGYKLLTVIQGDRFLLVPDGKEAPDGLPDDIRVLQAPVENIYMAASSSMALFDAIDSLDRILFSATRADGWYVENARKAMENGSIVFAGKYSEPDYEGLIEGDCGLALENTMLLHSPKVKDMIEQLGIPVLIEYSSYESHPLGRTEWVRFYGALLDKEDAADAYFESQAQQVRFLETSENAGKKVGIFYISTAGRVVVYSGASYVAKMVELAGGEYLFSDVIDEDSSRSSVNITLEDFYAKAVDADCLIYNATIDEPIYTLDELIAKSDVLADVKAVRDGNVWCTGKYMYQATDIIGDLILDIYHVIAGDGQPTVFLYQLQ